MDIGSRRARRLSECEGVSSRSILKGIEPHQDIIGAAALGVASADFEIDDDLRLRLGLRSLASTHQFQSGTPELNAFAPSLKKHAANAFK